jgi:hypothetical protein
MPRILVGMVRRFAEILLPQFSILPEERGRTSYRKLGKQALKNTLLHFTEYSSKI